MIHLGQSYVAMPVELPPVPDTIMISQVYPGHGNLTLHEIRTVTALGLQVDPISCADIGQVYLSVDDAKAVAERMTVEDPRLRLMVGVYDGDKIQYHAIRGGPTLDEMAAHSEEL